ncbi:unnamed protein product [Nippostrongylus brasiliensis]|uniref:Uncharacterized protein n=1 Tax=Nippostrongylus brasiliensis TaxID=27835 RepID=A0A0N4YF71_NIPBR|nr:hypothetical protein Q1695_012662 [Nippostrongylus brasiliensis]VDL78984.1 unnamed protein product [Nippostrongylus brasiliensis]
MLGTWPMHSAGSGFEVHLPDAARELRLSLRHSIHRRELRKEAALPAAVLQRRERGVRCEEGEEFRQEKDESENVKASSGIWRDCNGATSFDNTPTNHPNFYHAHYTHPVEYQQTWTPSERHPITTDHRHQDVVSDHHSGF